MKSKSCTLYNDEQVAAPHWKAYYSEVDSLFKYFNYCILITSTTVSRLTWGASGFKMEVYASTVMYSSGDSTILFPGTENYLEIKEKS